MAGDIPETSLTLQLEKFSTYWFDDGSLILTIQNQTFKVHRSLVCRHSPYLASLLAGNSRLDNGGCTYVTVDPHLKVSALDALALFSHLYHDSPLAINSPFPQIASILRISSPQQLDFPKIHLLTRHLFEEMFPGGPQPFIHPPFQDKALVLSTDFKLSNVRKALLYSLVTTTHFDHDEETEPDISADLRKETFLTALQPTLFPSDAPPPGGDSEISSTSEVLAYLSAYDRNVCKELMDQLIDHFTPTLFTPPSTAHMACTDVFADTWMMLVIQPALDSSGVYKPLETLELMRSIKWQEHGLCDLCVVEKREEWAREQNMIWDRMDDWLGK